MPEVFVAKAAQFADGERRIVAFAGGEIGGVDGDHHALAWLNSLRQDLTALGLESRLRDVTPSLKDIIAEHREAAE